MADDNILLISLSNIGDAVMTTPVLQSLHQHFPQAIIDIVGDQRSSNIFLQCPYRGMIFHKVKKKFLRGGLSLINTLRRQKYDLIVDLRTDGLAYLLRANKKLTGWNRSAYGPHAVEHHMGVIQEIHGNNVLPDCCVWTGVENDEFARRSLGNQMDKKILSLGPGANWPGKIWPEKNYLALIHELKNDFDAVVFLGDQRDQDLSCSIEKKTPLPAINLCGKTTLLQAAAVLKNTRAFIGNDSGLGHLASAVNTKTITIFGPGQPERYHPWGSMASWLVGPDQNINNVSVSDVVKCLRNYI